MGIKEETQENYVRVEESKERKGLYCKIVNKIMCFLEGGSAFQGSGKEDHF